MSNGRLTRREILSRIGWAAGAVPLLHARAHGASAPAFPRRLVLFTVPSCGPKELFWPRGTETDFTLSPLTTPLEPIKSKLNFLAGLAFHSAYASGGDYAVHQSHFHMLTGAKMVRHGFDNGAGGPSIDWMLANQVPALKALPFSQLVVGFNYESNGNTRAAPKSAGDAAPEITRRESPTSLFDQVFTGRTLTGNTVDPNLERNRQERTSVLDYLGRSLTGYASRLGTEDRQKVEFHMDAVRELEKGLSAGSAGTSGCTTGVKPAGGDFKNVNDVPKLVQQQLDVVTAALSCDLTRVVTLQWSHDGGNRWNYPWLGSEFNAVPPKDLDPAGTGLINQHYLQHESPKDAKLTAMRAKLEGWWVAQFAYLANKLNSIREGDGTMLDNTALVFFAAQGIPSAHSHYMNPVMIAGGCGGFFKTGRYIKVGNHTDFNEPETKGFSKDGFVAHNRLLASLVNAMGLNVETVGMSQYGGALNELRP